jgi:hypothetical protein
MELLQYLKTEQLRSRAAEKLQMGHYKYRSSVDGILLIVFLDGVVSKYLKTEKSRAEYHAPCSQENTINSKVQQI